ncbi:nuclear transport factor 2 family protein [Marinobacterium aestuariivivens]|uniref:Nuclear transport factor 2 family protein n=1 Tax=Marinobacterium aestuariivivens TaxID=1698799 RepID=A0ABW2A3G4_9GAMM
MKPEILQDLMAIQQLVYRYARAADNRDADAMAACFADQMVLQGPGFEIVENVAAVVIDGLSIYDWTMHNVHNLLYEVDGDQASGEAYCVASHLLEQHGRKVKLDWYIRYRDQLVRQNGEWRFSQRRLSVEYTTTVPVSPLGAAA